MAKGGEMEMRAQLPQQDLAFVHVGHGRQRHARSAPTAASAGTVWQVAPVIDPQTRQGEVRIAVPYDPAIRPGGFAEAKIRPARRPRRCSRRAPC